MAKFSPGMLLALGLGGAMVLTAAGVQWFTGDGEPNGRADAPAARDTSTAPSPDALRPALPDGERVKIAVVDPAPPMRIQPGPRMEVMSAVENGFKGFVRRSRQTLALNRAPPPIVDAPADDAGALINGQTFAELSADRMAGAGASEWRDEAPRPRVRTWSATVVTGDDPCDRLGSRADRLVCREPRLAEADARMRQALDRAAEGPERDAVLSDQSRWLAARERAAQDGPGAVDHMYAIRLRELEGR
ncbi:hypothetical protein [Brevundimonas lutea]|uniref:hypothetical protein n=1 Tax=Brevundimonas lutea TaxID=2293980 RepID=UPI000F028720|nr:hypothetical protein [Brevundimonas lutea]